MITTYRPGPAKIVWVIVALLAFLHWDFWYWSDRTLLFGFMPIGLAYQAGFSIAAALLWTAAVRYAWPTELEEWASAEVPPDAMPERVPGERAR